MRPILLLPLLLIACAGGPAPYGAASDDSDFGYRDQRIENDRYRVSYFGKTAEAAETGALRRAAEVTLAEGYEGFAVIFRETTAERSRQNQGARVGLGGGTGVGSGVSVGGSISLPLGGQSQPYRTRLEIRLTRGDGEDGPDRYVAADVLANLGTD